MTQLSSVKQHQKELRDLQLEARNSLYAIFKDKEAWQALQSRDSTPYLQTCADQDRLGLL